MRERYVDGKALHFALREWQASFARPLPLAIMAAVAVVLGLSGPFGTFADFGPLGRIAYWAVLVFATYAVGLATTLLVLFGLQGVLRNEMVRTLLGGLVAGVPVTALVVGFNWLVYRRPTMPPEELWVYCTAITLVVAVLSILARARRPEELQAPAAMVEAPREPAILQRVPQPQRGRLLALSVKDHYVDVITERGTSLVLIRLSDAIGETAPVAGMQIHRSHWVANDAIRRVVRSEGRMLLELENGLRLPVSRSYAPEVKAAGFFA